MIDVSEQLARAAHHKHEVDTALALRVASTLHAEFDWDFGEDWARVLKDSNVLACVYVKAPLVMVTRAARPMLGDELQGVESMEMTDWDAQEWCARGEALLVMFGSSFEDQPDFDTAAFSPGDLWFWTI